MLTKGHSLGPLLLLLASLASLALLVIAAAVAANAQIIMEGAQGGVNVTRIEAPSIIPAFIGFRVHAELEGHAVWWYTLSGSGNRTAAEELAKNIVAPRKLNLVVWLDIVDVERNVLAARIPINVTLDTSVCSRVVGDCPYGVIGRAAPICLRLDCNISLTAAARVPGLLPSRYTIIPEDRGVVCFYEGYYNKTTPNGTKLVPLDDCGDLAIVPYGRREVNVTLWPLVAAFTAAGGGVAALLMLKRREWTL